MDALAVDHADLPGITKANGNRHILVVTDLFTRFLWCVPVPDKSAQTTAITLNEMIIKPFEAPRVLVSDRGLAFTAKVRRCLYTIHNIKHCPTTAYRPQANSIVERVNRVIKERLRALIRTRDD